MVATFFRTTKINWRLSWLSLALASGVNLSATAAEQTSEQEISALLNTLRQSECQFERSGTWYSGEQAAEHLQGKWDYAKEDIDSSETFIREVASGSWLLGGNYHVRCPQAGSTQPSITTSAEWLNEQLEQLRQDSRTAP